MTDSERDPDTQLPRSLTLGDVFNAIRLAPQDISRLLSDWAAQYRGTTHDNLGNALAQHAQMVADPQSYGWKPQGAPTAPSGPPPIEQRAGYGQNAPQTAPAARGQAPTPGSLETPTTAPAAQDRASVAPQPAAPATPGGFEAGKAGTPDRPLGMADTGGSNEPSNATP